MRIGSAPCRTLHGATHVAAGLDQIGRGAALAQLGAQQFDVGVHPALESVWRVGPHQVHEFTAREDVLRSLEQGGEQRKSVPREHQPFDGTGPALRVSVDPVPCPECN